ncbi:MAG: hypothetical protein ACRC92_18745 [Peptostreptococcaceae bacterium]
MTDRKGTIIKILSLAIPVAVILWLLVHQDIFINKYYGVTFMSLPHYLKILIGTFTILPILILPLYMEGIIEIFMRGDTTISYKDLVDRRGRLVANIITSIGVIGMYLAASIIFSALVSLLLLAIVYLAIGWDYVGKVYLSMYPLTYIGISVIVSVIGMFFMSK